MDNPEKNGQILWKLQSPKTEQGIENMNRPIISNEIESVIWKLPTNQSPGPDDFTDEFYQISRG